MTLAVSDDDLPPAPALWRLRTENWSGADWVVGLLSVILAMGSLGFFTVSYVISVRSPGYFQEAALSAMPPKLDQTLTGSVEAGDAMPAQTVVRVRQPVPSDYQIVMVFQGEALLATRDELVRVRVGTVVPGLGEILSIEGTSTGGTVKAADATLTSAATAAK
ncbi:hypothetical protein [Aureimonas jatrophae]|uniref:Uncharacterized protein n=1 Tax=Aureimonas jatrophae TaxID=1166073 RepID=A0A1H0BV63_9HYPH|nr:hypothetical protein [Aureimonas jatrophae]MBB3948946.1 hypothetical protein [Aureimonas jatrophae]SDN49544.1 hypothetical protein SAMN05192530_10116 [Aureimonas jatrophae]